MDNPILTVVFIIEIYVSYLELNIIKLFILTPFGIRYWSITRSVSSLRPIIGARPSNRCDSFKVALINGIFAKCSSFIFSVSPSFGHIAIISLYISSFFMIN